MKKRTPLLWVIWVLVVVGAINWGLIGAFNFNLVTYLFGAGSLTMIVYILIGLAGLFKIFKVFGKGYKK